VPGAVAGEPVMPRRSARPSARFYAIIVNANRGRLANSIMHLAKPPSIRPRPRYLLGDRRQRCCACPRHVVIIATTPQHCDGDLSNYVNHLLGRDAFSRGRFR